MCLTLKTAYKFRLTLLSSDLLCSSLCCRFAWLHCIAIHWYFITYLCLYQGVHRVTKNTMSLISFLHLLIFLISRSIATTEFDDVFNNVILLRAKVGYLRLSTVMLQSFETTDPPPPGHSGGLTKFSWGLTKFSGDLTLFNNMLCPGG